MVINTSAQRNILFVNHSAVLGGGELSLLDLATAYRSNSAVLLLTDGPFRTKLEANGVKVLLQSTPDKLLNLRASAGLEALTSLSTLIGIVIQIAQKAKDFDLIHANSQKAFIVCALARFWGAPPLVWHLRDMLTANHFSPFNRRMAITLANLFAKKVIVNSQATGDAFQALGGQQNLVRLVYNGIAAENFDKITLESAKKLREKLNISEFIVIGSFSRISFWKGQHILLEAAKKIPQIHLLLVGDALFGEQEYFASLKKIADSPELKGRVHWLGFRQDVPLLMKACDIIVHTSTEPEPFGRVIIEGKLAQKPVIATSAGGARELIQDGITGILVPPNDPHALATKINQLLQNPAQSQEIAINGYNQAISDFSLTAMLKTFAQAIET